MHDSLMLDIPRTDETAAWLQEYSSLQRGGQIQAAFSKPTVKYGAFGGSSDSSDRVGSDNFHFVCVDLEQALAEFPEVGKRLNFPPGTRLVHFGPEWMTSNAAVRTVVTW